MSRLTTQKQADQAESDDAARNVRYYFECGQYMDCYGKQAKTMIESARRVMEFETTGRIKKRGAFGDYK